ncbi:MAG TPA: tetratricopeptide repeat protein, partial [Gemmatimonadota bacterium]|nr:tetratricopeptide repeat protein [Gemmatimonadota bacterium]
VSDWRRHAGLAGALMVLLLALGPMAAHAQQKQEGGGGSSSGECKLSGGDVTQKAEDEIGKASKAESDSAAMKSYQSAMRLITVALSQKADDPAALWLKGRAQIGLHQYASADSALDQFVSLMPGCASLVHTVRQQAWVDLYNRGIRAYQAGNDTVAMTSFDTASVILKDPRSLNNAALLHQRLGDADGAAALYRQSIQTGGDSAQVRAATINLAELLKDQGKSDEAFTVYRNYIADHPNAVLPRINLAVGLAQAGQKDSAQAMMTSMLDRQDLAYDDLADLGTGLLQVQAYKEAEQAFQRAHKENPYAREGLADLVQAAMGAGDFKTAASVGDSLLASYPYDKNAYRAVAQSLDKLGNKQAVQARLRKMQSLPLEFTDLQMVNQGGTYVIQGEVASGTAGGSKVQVPFTFYAADGSTVTTKTVAIDVPQGESTGQFQFQVQSQTPIVGFTYGEAN